MLGRDPEHAAAKSTRKRIVGVISSHSVHLGALIKRVQSKVVS